MGKEKKRKRRHSSSSESSSRRSESYSSSSESERHKHKKHKHKSDKKHRHEKEREERRENKKEYKKERENYRQEETLPKLEEPIRENNIRQKERKEEQDVEIAKLEEQKLESKREEIQQSEARLMRDEVNPEVEMIQEEQKPKKEEPNFEPSGILLEYYNAREGVSLRFHEPPEAREPQEQWRMYVFKGEEVLKPIELTKSCYLIGKDDRVVDILAENPSISRQHCVLQFRLIQKRQTEGEYLETIKPYIMDLESTNGTFLNDERIESGRYYELLHRDVLKFGFSDREYVIVKWNENQQGEQEEDN